MNLLRSYLVVVEGIDGSGKSTLVKSIESALEKYGLPSLITKEPGGTRLGRMLRALLQEKSCLINPLTEFLLFAADRAQHIEELIIPALKKNTIVISDRMADSSYVYQGIGKGVDCEMIQQVNRWSMQEIVPDLTVYMRITPDLAQKRVHSRNAPLTSFEKEEREFFEKAVHGFDELYKDRSDVLILDGEKTISELTEKALVAIKQLIDQRNML